jgi:hypothetical protein
VPGWLRRQGDQFSRNSRKNGKGKIGSRTHGEREI